MAGCQMVCRVFLFLANVAISEPLCVCSVMKELVMLGWADLDGTTVSPHLCLRRVKLELPCEASGPFRQG